MAGLHAAIKKADEKNGKIFIADGQYTKELDGIRIHPLEDKVED